MIGSTPPMLEMAARISSLLCASLASAVAACGAQDGCTCLSWSSAVIECMHMGECMHCVSLGVAACSAIAWLRDSTNCSMSGWTPGLGLGLGLGLQLLDERLDTWVRVRVRVRVTTAR